MNIEKSLVFIDENTDEFINNEAIYVTFTKIFYKKVKENIIVNISLI